MRFSIIIPVFNRPEELHELLQSLEQQKFKDFEVVVVEDGSSLKSERVVGEFKTELNVTYFFKKNEGPSIGRSYGAEKASGEYLIFTDSDCILPSEYLDIIDKNLLRSTDVFGGPDKSHPDFNIIQKAISFSMTSLLTTGGVRGREKSVEEFYPRSFNMGVKKSVFDIIGGFPKTKMWPGEDMVLAIELKQRGYNLQYIHNAFVYHKRRTSVRKFYKQVFNFGKVRIYISRLYPDTFKFIYVLPVLFVLFVVVSVICSIYDWVFLIPILAYLLTILMVASIQNRSLFVGVCSVITTLTQFIGYANGLIGASFKIYVFRNPEFVLDRKEMFNRQME